MKMAADIVIAFLGQRAVEPNELPSLVRAVREALTDEGGNAQPSLEESLSAPDPATERLRLAETRRPAVPVEESVTRDYIISLEDGQRFRSLRRHLMAKYGLTPEQYRERWNLPADYPMVAPSYAESRSDVAKRIGLGRRGDGGLAKGARAKRRTRPH
jgi:predicted transcriptional regulator